MKLTQKKRHVMSVVAMALVVLMAGDVIYQLAMHIRWRRWMPDTVLAEVAATQPAETQPAGTQPADTQPASTQSAKTTKKAAKKKPPKPYTVHTDIKKRNIFTKPKPTGHGMTLTGVIGATAQFKDRGGKTVYIDEGKSAQGVKVTSIKGYEVTIDHKGKTQTMKLFAGGIGSIGSGGGPGRGSKAMRGPPRAGGPPMPRRARIKDLPAAERKRMLELRETKIRKSRKRRARP